MNPTFLTLCRSLETVYTSDEARALAFWIMEEVGYTRADILTCKDTKNIPNSEIILQRLLKKEPVQYVFGHTDWLGMRLRVTPDTLIPRPETAELVRWVDDFHRDDTRPLRLLDIGTGSGCIAIALQQHHPDWQVAACDCSPQALDIARENARWNRQNVHLFLWDIFTPCPSSEQAAWPCDIVVSNPPYICESERHTMDTTVLDYEPASALFVPDNDPLCFYRRIATMHRHGELFFEVNERYAKEVAHLLDSIGYSDVQIKLDTYEKERFVYGCRSSR